MPGEAVFFLIVFTLGGTVWLLTPVMRALAERIKPRAGAPGGAGGHEETLTALEDLRREVAELAERVDFTERLLAKQREAERLGPPC